jgi:O-antigen/teichoic acid export membrane protein
MILLWTDTLMLGHFKTTEVVGLYNAANPVSHFVFTPLVALQLIYVPVASGLYARDSVVELRQSYTLVTRWAVHIALPLLLMVLFFSEQILSLFFGTDYINASPALKLLALGWFVNVGIGPAAMVVMAMEKSNFLLRASLIGAGMNILINLLLIPPLGMVGAAIATVISITLSASLMLGKAYHMRRIQPLSPNLLKPLTIFLIALLPAYLAFPLSSIPSWWLPLILLLFYSFYFAIILITGSLGREERAVLRGIGLKLESIMWSRKS